MVRWRLNKEEAKEWKSLYNKSRYHNIPIKRTGPANVRFDKDVYAQLGTGHATMIMDARIRVKKMRRKRRRGK